MYARYKPIALGAGGSTKLNGIGIGGFICTVSGTLTVTGKNGNVLLNALPVTAGTTHLLPMLTDGHNAVVTLTTAAGTLLVDN